VLLLQAEGMLKSTAFPQPESGSHFVSISFGYSVSLAFVVVRFYEHVNCPVWFQATLFDLSLGEREISCLAVGMWEASEAVSKGRWELLETGFWFSTVCTPRHFTAHDVRTVANRDFRVQVLMDSDSLASKSIVSAGFVQLPPLIADGDGVVFGDYALGLDREDPVQIAAPAAAERQGVCTV
jgi:hypothetical protein